MSNLPQTFPISEILLADGRALPAAPRVRTLWARTWTWAERRTRCEVNGLDAWRIDTARTLRVVLRQHADGSRTLRFYSKPSRRFYVNWCGETVEPTKGRHVDVRR